jgi:hypothetical protein
VDGLLRHLQGIKETAGALGVEVPGGKRLDYLI